jgi:2-succinyl-6-hydroxy-2,4-cyclohexadiene-1-carboxylate synthase
MFEFSKCTRGDPRRPPLIFLHGFLGCKEDWEETLPFFERQFYCIALDLPGHGATPYCEDILGALKRELQQPIIVGYSMGGRIALQLQESTKAIVVLSGHPGLESEEEKAARRKVDEQWCEKLGSMSIDAFIAQWYQQPIFQTLGSIPKRRLSQNPQDLARVLRQMSLANQPHFTRFSRPALFLHGEEDLKYRQLYNTLPKSVSVHSIKNCGHAIPMENAKGGAEAILNWLNDANS